MGLLFRWHCTWAWSRDSNAKIFRKQYAVVIWRQLMLFNTGTSLRVISRGIPCLDQFSSSSLITPCPHLIFIQGTQHKNLLDAVLRGLHDRSRDSVLYVVLLSYIPFEELTLLCTGLPIRSNLCALQCAFSSPFHFKKCHETGIRDNTLSGLVSILVYHIMCRKCLPLVEIGSWHRYQSDLGEYFQHISDIESVT